MAQVKVSAGNSYLTTMQAGDLTWIADEPVSDGGTGAGPTPMQQLIGSLGACAAVTVRLYALRKGWPLEGMEVTVDYEKYKKSEYPAYTGESDTVNDFKQTIVFHGPLTEEQKLRLLEIAGKCPVHRVLTQPNFIVEELLREETEAETVEVEKAELN
jgi:putative redox protein